MIIAWSIFHGGPAGNFFSKSLFNGLVHDANSGNDCELFVEDIPNMPLRDQIAKVNVSVEIVNCF